MLNRYTLKYFLLIKEHNKNFRDTMLGYEEGYTS